MADALYYQGQRYEKPLNPLALPAILSLQDGAYEGDFVLNGSVLEKDAALRTHGSFQDVIGSAASDSSVTFSTDNAGITITRPDTGSGFRLGFNIPDTSVLPAWIKLTIKGPKTSLTYKLFIYDSAKI